MVDTNVPIVANGRPDPNNGNPPSHDCRIAAVQFLQKILKNGTLVVDLAGEIQSEYRNHLNASGQPGVGDRFYQQVINCAPRITERVDLLKRPDGEFVELPQALIDENFDKSDRKFAALANFTGAAVVNATDSDWVHHRTTLKSCGIRVKFLCGNNIKTWFA